MGIAKRAGVCACARALCCACYAPVRQPGLPQRLAGFVQCRSWELPLCLLVQLQPRRAHTMAPPGPARAFMRPSLALACESHTLWDSITTCLMNCVPMSCGPASPRWAVRRDGVAMAAAHYSKTARSHNWPSTCEACGPTYVMSHECRRCLAGRHSWACIGHSHKCLAISRPLPHSRHCSCICTLRCCARSANNGMVGRLCMQWATTRVLVVHPCGHRRLLLQPLLQVCRS